MRWLGTVPYRDALALQLETHRNVAAGTAPHTLLLLEHPPVYTTGKRGDPGGFLVPPDVLRERGAEVIATDRGGLVTFHGPGQLVGYPILALDRLRLTLNGYVDILLDVLAATLSACGVRAEADSTRPGVYVQGRKIAAVGVRLAAGVTRHGFAVNLSTDLSWFDAIVPCGLHGVQATSLREETGHCPPLRQFGTEIAESLSERLSHSSKP